MKFRAIHSPAYIEERLLRLMSEIGPITPLEYHQMTGVARSSAERQMKDLHRHGILHIATHRARETGIPSPAFYFGRHPDARPAQKLTSTEKSARYREKLKAERPEEWRKLIQRTSERMDERKKMDAELADKVRRYKANWLSLKRSKLRGGLSMRTCPIPRPKFYRNIFEDQRKAA